MDYMEYMEQYHKEHYCCPVCQSKNYSCTMVGFIYDPGHPEDYKDSNSVHCYTCGWKGVVHDLVPKPPKTGYKFAYLTGDREDKCVNYSDIVYKLEDKDELKKMCDTIQKQNTDKYVYFYEVKID
jgi:hypothetical protein